MGKFVAVSKPFMKSGDSRTTISCRVEGENLPSELWFSVPNEYASYLAIECPDWIATSLLIPAMLRGGDLRIEAPVSEDLLISLQGALQTLFRDQIGGLKPVAVMARKAGKRQLTGSAELAGTGFSAGVDSFCTLSEFSVDILVTNNVGAMGEGEGVDGIFKVFCERTEAYAKSKGSRSVSVDSNLAAFYRDFSFQQTHTIRNVSAILVLRNLFRRYYYSSTYGPLDLHLGPTYDMSTADPAILKLLSNGGLEFVSSGSQRTRWEKTEIVSQMPDAKRMLDVCAVSAADKRISGHVNCGKCFKCARQLLSFEIMGCLEEFEHLFDMNAYSLEYPHLMANIVNSSSSSSIEREIIAKARAAGREIPVRYRVLAIAKRRAPVWFSWRLGQAMARGPVRAN